MRTSPDRDLLAREEEAERELVGDGDGLGDRAGGLGGQLDEEGVGGLGPPVPARGVHEVLEHEQLEDEHVDDGLDVRGQAQVEGPRLAGDVEGVRALDLASVLAGRGPAQRPLIGRGDRGSGDALDRDVLNFRDQLCADMKELMLAARRAPANSAVSKL